MPDRVRVHMLHGVSSEFSPICEKRANIWIGIELLQAVHRLEPLTEEHVGGE